MAGTLHERLLKRILADGSITFAEFMEAALYDPEQGFYSRLPVGPDRHFVTSPHVSVAFGALLARQLAEAWEHLGGPVPFRVAEVGAGDGTLAAQIIREAASVAEFGDALEYLCVERSPEARRVLSAEGFPVADSLQHVGRAHVVLANEVLDNLPFHRLRGREGGLVEVKVGVADGRLVEVEEKPTPAVASLAGAVEEGEERPVSPAALALVAEIARVLERGYAFLFDYGFTAGEAPGSARSYRDHRVLGDVLAEPGGRDVTAAVDLDAVTEEGARLGLQVWGPVSQREALLALGVRRWIQAARTRQVDAEARGDWRAANRLYAERSKASILIDESKLGGLRLLALGSRGLPAPAAVLPDREAGC